MDLVVKTKYAARKIALCIGHMTGEPAPPERASVKIGSSALDVRGGYEEREREREREGGKEGVSCF